MQILCEEAIEPKCTHFGTCGGCRYQQIPYDEQLLQKEQFVHQLFQEHSRNLCSIIGSISPWNYRNKMEFSFSQSKAGERFLGLMMKGKRGRVVSLEECHLTSTWFTQVLRSVHEWWKESGLAAYHPFSDGGSLRTLTLREGIRTKERMVILTVSGNLEYSLEEHHLDAFKEAILGVGACDCILQRTQKTAKKTPTQFFERVVHGKDHIHEILYESDESPLFFKIRGASFFQPNTQQAEIIYQKTMELAEISPQDIIYDLYCGIGSFGIFASRYAKKVFGVEIVPEAVLDARDNIDLNQISNMEVFQGDVGDLLSQKQFPSPTTVIIDPPRVGLMPKALEEVASLNPEKIIYISCNPLSQIKNVESLIEQGYVLDAIQPIDQFPHTPHIENLAVLKRIS